MAGFASQRMARTALPATSAVIVANGLQGTYHWACLGALCEFLPLPGNRVTLAGEKDANGLPVARFS